MMTPLPEHQYIQRDTGRVITEELFSDRVIHLLYNHTKEGIDPLGPDNVAIISAGLLVGTLASASARTHVMGKSPLTGGVGSANMGVSSPRS